MRVDPGRIARAVLTVRGNLVRPVQNSALLQVRQQEVALIVPMRFARLAEGRREVGVAAPQIFDLLEASIAHDSEGVLATFRD